jgi:hypothetical protein
MTKPFLKISSSFFIALSLSLSAMADCDGSNVSDAFVNAYYLKTLDGICTLNVLDKNTTPPRRNFIWGDDGSLSINTQTALSGRASANGGTHKYFILPSDGAPTIADATASGERLEVFASGLHWPVSTHRPTISIPDSCKGSVSPLTSGNQGGVQIQSCDNKIIIDSGYGSGNGPDHNKVGQSSLRDPQGHSCTVTNSEIYKYQGYGDEQVFLKFKTSSALAGFLKSRCPNLNTSSLSSSAATVPSPAASPASTHPSSYSHGAQ